MSFGLPRTRFTNVIYLCIDSSQNLMCKIIISKQNAKANFYILYSSHRFIYFVQEKQCINSGFAANIPLFLHKHLLESLV